MNYIKKNMYDITTIISYDHPLFIIANKSDKDEILNGIQEYTKNEGECCSLDKNFLSWYSNPEIEITQYQKIII